MHVPKQIPIALSKYSVESSRHVIVLSIACQIVYSIVAIDNFGHISDKYLLLTPAHILNFEIESILTKNLFNRNLFYS